MRTLTRLELELLREAVVHEPCDEDPTTGPTDDEQNAYDRLEEWGLVCDLDEGCPCGYEHRVATPLGRLMLPVYGLVGTT